jgi:hypothetical protein
LKLAKLRPVERVEYDTGPNNLRGPCTPKTRERILDDLMAWATDDTTPAVYWLAGMAGTGKTTIAYSFCERLQKAGLLYASFFCTRTLDSTREPRAIIPTIAYQIAIRIKGFLSALLENLQNPDNNEIRNKAIGSQFMTLMHDPAKAALSTGLKHPLIVWDGFDEAKDRSREVGSDEIGQILSIFLKHSGNIPFKIFISSRIDDEIHSSFKLDGADVHKSLFLHDVEKNIVEADIRHYIKESLRAITKRREGGEWISDEQVEELVTRSGKLFVYAAALVSFLGSGGVGQVDERLELILQNCPQPSFKDSPYKRLDDLYTQILKTAKTELNENDVRSVLQIILAARKPLDIENISTIIKWKPSQVQQVVTSLQSVLTVPKNSSDTTPVSIFHASFRDFLIDSGRSKDHFLDLQESHHLLASCCLQFMEKSLIVDNICGIDSKDTPRSSIEHSAIQNSISSTLEYACASWLSHVMELSAELVRALEDHIIAFFDHCILRWIECMAWLGRLGDAVTSLRALEVSQAVCCYFFYLLYIIY